MSHDDDVQRACKDLGRGGWREASTNVYYPHELHRMADAAKEGGGHLTIVDHSSSLSDADANKIAWANPQVELKRGSPTGSRSASARVGKKSIGGGGGSTMPSRVDGAVLTFSSIGIGLFLLVMWCSLSGDWHWAPGSKEGAIAFCSVITFLLGCAWLSLFMSYIKGE